MTKVTIDLSDEEVKFVRSFCILRPAKAAAEFLGDHIDGQADPGDIDTITQVAQDIEEAGVIFEEIRSKLVNAINRQE